MMRAKDIDPEKLNRFMELFADRSQFDPLMDAIVHQPLPSYGPHGRLSEPQRQQIDEREGIERAYNQYIRAVNNAKRLKSYIDDPYQTRLMEYHMNPVEEERAIRGIPHQATILREAIIRAKAQQAQDALEGRTPMSRTQLKNSISRFRDATKHKLRDELMGGNPFMEMPNIGRLLGPEQERVQMIDRARRSRREGDLR